jgi:hypothetical protein
MNRNMKLGIVVLMVALFVGLTYGAVVTYLSNTTTATVTVESPMFVGISLGRDSWSTTECWRADPGEWVLSFPEGIGHGGEIHDWAWSDWTTEGTLEIPNIRGGGIITIYTMSKNLANAEITAHEEIRISNPSGIAQADFVEITSRFDSIYGDLGYGTLHTDVPSGDVQRIDANTIELWSATDTSTWGAGEADVAMWTITFNPAAFGTYTISYRVVPAP